MALVSGKHVLYEFWNIYGQCADHVRTTNIELAVYRDITRQSNYRDEISRNNENLSAMAQQYRIVYRLTWNTTNMAQTKLAYDARRHENHDIVTQNVTLSFSIMNRIGGISSICIFKGL